MLRFWLLLQLLPAVVAAAELNWTCRWERRTYRGMGPNNAPNIYFVTIALKTSGSKVEGKVEGGPYHETIADGTIKGNKVQFMTGTKGDRLYTRWELTLANRKATGTYTFPDGIVGEVQSSCTGTGEPGPPARKTTSKASPRQ